MSWNGRTTTLAVALALAALASPASARQASTAADPLYQQLGGYDTIAAVVDDFFARFDADPLLVPFLGGINAANAGRIRQHFVDFLCATTGGPCVYNGRDMTAAHEGMKIEGRHFDAVMRHLSDALRAQHVPAAPGGELLARLRALRPMIVRS